MAFKLGNPFRKKPDPEPKRERKNYGPNPHSLRKASRNSSGFFSPDTGRMLGGWETYSSSIDNYLSSSIEPLRARSREATRRSAHGKRFVSLLKSNIVGPSGFRIQAQVKRQDRLDEAANREIEYHWKEWQEEECDFLGRFTFKEYEDLFVSSYAADGEAIFYMDFGAGAGKYGFQIHQIDAALLDSEYWGLTRNGGQVRLGVQYSELGIVEGYWFRDKDHYGNYFSGRRKFVPANHVLHSYVSEHVDQSRGIPLMHASLERLKNLDKYRESALYTSRAGAQVFGVISSESETPYVGESGGGDDPEYDTSRIGVGQGGVQGDPDVNMDEIENGTIKNIGNRKLDMFDPNYPHQMYAEFVKTTLEEIASGMNMSYQSLSGDLTKTSFASGRTGVMEQREMYEMMQNWMSVRFHRPIYCHWLKMALMSEKIKVNGRPLRRDFDHYKPALFQGRRWKWVDPQKDSVEKQTLIGQRLKSRSQLIRENGDDPEEVFKEIAAEQARMEELGIVIDPMAVPSEEKDDKSDDVEDEE